MENNQQQKGIEVNPNYVIDELINENARLNMELSKLRALMRQKDEESDKQEQQQQNK